MTTGILLAGYLFWSAIAFFGIRSGLQKGNERAIALFAALEDRSPVSLVVPGGILFAVGLGLVFVQASDIDAQAGLVGPKFALGIVLGVIGAGLVAGGMFSESD